MESYEINRTPNLKREFLSLNKYKSLFRALSWRMVLLQYQVLSVGVAWALLQPLVTTSIFFVAFKGAIGENSSDYFLYVLSGIILWQFFAGGFSLGATIFLQNADMVKKVYFPRFILPNTAIASKLIDLALSMVLMVFLTAYLSEETNWLGFIFFSLLAVCMAILVTSGFAMVFSVLTVQYRGIQSFLPFGIHILFITSSAMYQPSKLIEYELINWLFQFNPLSGVFYVFRLGIFNDSPDLNLVLLYVLWSVAIFLMGFWGFWLGNRKLPDYL